MTRQPRAKKVRGALIGMDNPLPAERSTVFISSIKSMDGGTDPICNGRFQHLCPRGLHAAPRCCG